MTDKDLAILKLFKAYLIDSKVTSKSFDEEAKIKCKLRDYLEKAGAVIVGYDDNDVDIDLSIEELNKDS